MCLITCNLAALGIAVIYYGWRDGYYGMRLAQTEKIRRERVAYMLWIAANK